MTESLFTEIDSPANIPTGIVTFLFTDIQGSTQLLERLREQYAIVLAEQRDVLRAVFARWNGHEIGTQGDSFFVVFSRALDAVNCTVEAQQALAAHVWPQNVNVYVRMGLHTGEPIIARTGYVGMDVHLAARIGAAGHGGQVLLSQTTHGLAYQDLPAGVTLRDLGAHKLKDIRQPQQIYQIEAAGLAAEFPPLKTMATEEEPPTSGNSPFKGLQFFDEADADLFFGREAMTAQLADRIQSQRFLAIIGASGSGKSSIVRAGLVPLLKRDLNTHWQIHVITPTAHPLEALAASLTHGAESITATSTLIDDLMRDQRSLHLFAQKSYPTARLLVVADQFEELFTLCRNEAERKSFVDNLLAAQAAEDSSTTLIIVLRADFYEHLAQYAALREAVAKHQEYLGPMSAAELREAIEEPAKRGGWEFSPGLVDLMLHDVGASIDQQPEPGALPLLSHALLETWRRRRGNVMTLKGYSEAGGVRGAIAHTAETVFYTELDEEQQQIARSIFLRLTELGEGTQDTRRRASIDELFPSASFATPAQVEEVVTKLADARLITTGEDTVEVAHEALIREWSTLRDWLSQNREGLRLQRHLTEAAHEWELLERDASALYRGTRLAQAVEWAEANPRELNVLERAFLDASKEHAAREEAEREAQRRRELEAAQKLAETEERALTNLRRRAVYLSGALIVAALFAIVAIIFGQQSNSNAQQAQLNLQNSQTSEARAVDESQVRATAQANAVAQQAAAVAESKLRATQQAIAEANYTRAEAQRLAAEATNLLLRSGNSEQIALLSLRSMNLQYSPQGDIALTAASRLILPAQIFLGHTKEVNKVAFTSDGRYLFTGSGDGSVRVWDVQTGKEVRQLGTPEQYGYVNDIAVSPDGRSVLVGGNSNQAILWDIQTGELLITFTHPSGVLSVAFTPDGQQIATLDADKNVYLWNIKTGEIIWKMMVNDDISTITISPDGKYLATGGIFASPRLWEVQTGKAIPTFASSFSSSTRVAFSPDSRYLLIGSRDDTEGNVADAGAHLLDVQTGQEVRRFTGVTDFIQSVAFSPDGRYVAAGSNDQTVRLWAAQSGELLRTFHGHTDRVVTLAFSADGKYLASGGVDQTARVWEVNPNYETPDFIGHSGSVYPVTFSPDGQYLLTGGTDQTARVWDVRTGQQLRSFIDDTVIWFTAFSNDGQFAFTVSGSGTVRVWNIKTGEEVQRLPLGSDYTSVAFSPDKKYVLAGYGSSNDLSLWSLDTGTVITTFVGPKSTSWGVTISSDGKYALAGLGSGAGFLWNFPDGTNGRRLIGHTGIFLEAVFSSDSQYVLTGSLDKTVILWGVQAAQELRRFEGHIGGVSTIALSPDSKLVATGSADGTARIWDVQTGQELRRFDFRVFVNQVRFSPDGKHLAIVGDNDGKVNLWDVDYHDTIKYLCSRLPRDLSDAERTQYGITDTSPTCPAK